MGFHLKDHSFEFYPFTQNQQIKDYPISKLEKSWYLFNANVGIMGCIKMGGKKALQAAKKGKETCLRNVFACFSKGIAHFFLRKHLFPSTEI